MKKTICLAMTASLMAITGCKDVPSADTIGTLSKTIGYAAGITCNLSNISPGCRKTIIEVLDIASEVVPGTNETFTTAWTPIVKKTVDEFVENGKIDKGEGALIVSAMGVATSGLDYIHMLQIGEILRSLKDQGKTVIVVTHDRELIKECCDFEISLRDFNQIKL